MDRIVANSEPTKMLKENDSEWSLKISRAVNGYVTEENSYGDKRTSVFAEEDGVDEQSAEFKCMEELLWYICEYFGIMNSKHKENRIRIDVIKNK